MTRRFIAHRFIDYYDSPRHNHVVLSKMIAHAPDGITVAELTDRSGFSEGTVRSFVSEVHYLRYVHISGWLRRSPFSLSPIYKLGNAKDAPKSPSAPKKEAEPKTVKPVVIDLDKPLREHCVALQKALVPERTEKEQYEVNRLYLNWISEGVYG
jgi:hypothetical protein